MNAKIKRAHRGLIVALFLGVASHSLAQKNEAAAVVAVVGGSTLDSPVGSEDAALEIRANSDSSKAAIRIGSTVSGSKRFSILTLTGSAPINKNDDTTLASFDGFANAATLELKFTQFSVPSLSPLREAVKGTYAEVREAIARGSVARGDSETLEAGRKLPVNDDNVDAYAPEKRDAFESLFWDPKSHSHIWGLSGTIGYQEYKYLNTPGLTEDKTDKMPYGLSAFWAVIPAGSETLFTISFEYQKAFKNAESKSYASPPDANGLQEVMSGPIGPPLNDDKQLLSVELRRYLGTGGKKKSIGVALTVAYDFKSSEFAAKLPVWLLRSDKNALTGGLEFGWDGRTEKATVGVVVGSGFGVFR